MFKFTDIKSKKEKLEKIEKTKTTFGSLKSRIDVIQSYEIGTNLKHTNLSYDLVIISEYKSWDDLNTYINHIEHKKAISICADIKKDKAIIDYEY